MKIKGRGVFRNYSAGRGAVAIVIALLSCSESAHDSAYGPKPSSLSNEGPLGRTGLSQPSQPPPTAETPKPFQPRASGPRFDPTGNIATATPKTKKSPKREGRWRLAKTGGPKTALTADQLDTIAELEAIGYVAGSVEAKVSGGVAVYEHNKVYGGLNFFTSGHGPLALLMDMNGAVLHTWHKKLEDVWPGLQELGKRQHKGFWRRAYLYENGDVLAIFEGVGIFKLDRDSNLIWENLNGAHHDLEVLPNNEIYVLTRKAHFLTRFGSTFPILEDFISILSPDGTEKRRISLLEFLEKSEYNFLWKNARKIGDSFHTNTVCYLDGSIAGKVSEFAAGNVLISILKLNTIAVVDIAAERIVWALKGPFIQQHDPKIVRGGNLLLFNNGRKGKSSVMEFDPATSKLKWEYRGPQDAPLSSATCSTAQREYPDYRIGQWPCDRDSTRHLHCVGVRKPVSSGRKESTRRHFVRNGASAARLQGRLAAEHA